MRTKCLLLPIFLLATLAARAHGQWADDGATVFLIRSTESVAIGHDLTIPGQKLSVADYDGGADHYTADFFQQGCAATDVLCGAVSGFNNGTGIGSTGTVSWGILGADYSGSAYAGYFIGDVEVTGTLFKGGGGFLIDHPADPANKVLRHSFVESPDMKDIYDGIATLGGDGEATVRLPGYFQLLNSDYRYSLTPLGAPAPNLYVKREIKDDRFVIAGGKPGQRVSWMVTGIRQDAFAKKNRIVVESVKGDGNHHRKGKYLHPDAFGLDAGKFGEHPRAPRKNRKKGDAGK